MKSKPKGRIDQFAPSVLIQELAKQNEKLKHERDQLLIEVTRLTNCLHQSNHHMERFERDWYLRGDCIEELEQDRDQLKVALEIVTNELESWKATEEDPDSIRAIQIGKQAIRDCKGLSLAEHNAQVIDETIKYMQRCYPSLCVECAFTGGWLKALRKRANQLRQKAQEAK